MLTSRTTLRGLYQRSKASAIATDKNEGYWESSVESQLEKSQTLTFHVWNVGICVAVRG